MLNNNFKNMNKKLTKSLIILLLLFPALTQDITVNKATLINLDGTKKIVLIGSVESNFYTGKLGYHLLSDEMLGAVINQTPALFETSLATAIGKTDSAMTLVSGKTRDGLSLSGNYCFTIDSGLNTAEYVCGTASSTVITSMTRGIGSDGVTSYTSLKYAHRYGADVKITDFPVLQQFGRILSGLDTTPGGLTFGTSTISGINNLNINGSLTGIITTPASSATTSAANVDYVNKIVVSGGVDASSVSKGISYLSSNASSSTRPIALNSEEVATTTGANKVVRASSTGLISPTFIDGTGNYTFSGSNSFTATTTLNNLNVTGTSTFAVSPIVIAKGSYDVTPNASVSTTTITHSLNVVPYLITFDYYAADTTSSGSKIVGNGKYTTGSSTLTYTGYLQGPVNVVFNQSNSLVTHFQGTTTCDGSINPVNVGTSTALINYTACNDGTLTDYKVYWTAFGIRK